ncbi:hypothetical protein ZWY2020_011211 [Hordeum vulgare]|nr:hypothetical protein ZWY2020_011211 [Hordeum vulgare]
MGTHASPDNNTPPKDERTAREKAIDDWLPITSSRKAKWWYSAFHNVTAMVGAGVLSLPYAMSELVMTFSWIITVYTLWQMVEMHEMVPGKRFDRYHELGQHAFGDKLGSLDRGATAARRRGQPEHCLHGHWRQLAQEVPRRDCDGKCKDIKLTYFIMIFASVHLCSPSYQTSTPSPASPRRSRHVTSYSTIAWGASLHKGRRRTWTTARGRRRQQGRCLVSWGPRRWHSPPATMVLEIQATIPSTPGNPSKKPMWKGVVVAYIIIAACYFPVAFIGYWAFGNSVDDNILITLNKPKWLIAMANMMVVVHPIGSYQICIVLGVLLMIVAPIGGLRQIIISAKTYKFYS